MTSVSNDNYSDRPISRYISQISANRRQDEPQSTNQNHDPDFGEDDILPSLGRAVVAVGGGADLGAGQIRVRDHEEVDIIQRDLGTGYTAIRKLDTGEYGFIPTSSLVVEL